ncbi:MAG: DNA polymerase III subunit gamma/tau [Desulfatibacillum sp.]|nr:DNA polymerase III subunit gamma/tau [Desulfatibacillum sp.]
MSYLVLARKYRPLTFDEVVAQPHITDTLKNAIKQSRVAHALCMAGPRGTGKTTVARILAKAMNCVNGPTPEPCGVCASCREITAGNAVDVFEIDGASNNSVDQVRELRENVQYAPARGNYKVYIIDEVHMLSQAAFNALLKTLEEPPPHVMFILATTESHKIPVTILSRCQRYDFKRISLDAIVGHLAKLADLEKFTIEEQSLWAVARRSGGCMRDALSLLDQVMAYTTGQASFDQVLDILGVAGRKSLFALAEALLTRNVPSCLTAVDDLYAKGYDLKQVMADLVEHMRDLTVVKMVKDPTPLLDVPPGEIQAMQDQVARASLSFLNQVLSLLFKEEAMVRMSPQPRLALEVAMIRVCEVTPAVAIDTLIAALDNLASLPASANQIINIGPGPATAPDGGNAPPPAENQAPPAGSSMASEQETPAAPAQDTLPVEPPAPAAPIPEQTASFPPVTGEEESPFEEDSLFDDEPEPQADNLFQQEPVAETVPEPASPAPRAMDAEPDYPEPEYALPDFGPDIPDYEPDIPDYGLEYDAPAPVLAGNAFPANPDEEEDLDSPEPEEDSPEDSEPEESEPPVFEGDPWKAFAAGVEKKSVMLGITLSNCRLKEYGEGRFTVETDGTPFSRDQLNTTENQATLKGVCRKLFGSRVQFGLEEPSEENRPEPMQNQAERRRELEQEALNHPLVEEAVRIFEGKVVEIRHME